MYLLQIQIIYINQWYSWDWNCYRLAVQALSNWVCDFQQKFEDIKGVINFQNEKLQKEKKEN
jgi:hypothetical protein